MDNKQVIQYLKEKKEFKDKDINIIKPLTGGITNDNYLIEIDSKKYVLRLPTPSSKKMIDRDTEYKNNTIGCNLNLNAPCIYFNCENGIKIAEYIEKSDIDVEEFKENKEAIEKIAKTIKKLHSSNILMENDFDIFEKKIDRETEYKNNTIGCNLNLNAPCIYFNCENGIKIAEYIEKSDIDVEEFKENKEAIEKIAKTIKKLHSSNILMENDFDIFEK